MATWINHVTVAAPRNGTTSHTVGPDGTGGTVVGGTAFTPTAGRYLLAVCEGAVAFTTPTGYALGTSAVNNTGLYAFYRANATGTTADRLTTTHNGSNYPAVFDFYEFPAGTTWKNGVGATGLGSGGSAASTPTLGSLTGTYWAGYAAAYVVDTGITAPTNVTWTAPAVERSETTTPFSATAGYAFSMADAADATGASTSASFDTSGDSGLISAETLTFALVVPAGGATVTGAAALSGQSTLTATGTVQTPAADISGAAALAAAGALTATGKAAVRASAPLAATSSATTTGRADVKAAEALTATGSLTATAHLQTTGTAQLTATGTLTAQAASGAAVNITVQAGQPARAWTARQPTHPWAAGQPTT